MLVLNQGKAEVVQRQRTLIRHSGAVCMDVAVRIEADASEHCLAEGSGQVTKVVVEVLHLLKLRVECLVKILVIIENWNYSFNSTLRS